MNTLAKLCLLLPLCAHANSVLGADEDRLLIRGGTLFDGTGSILKDHAILIHGGKIQRVAPVDEMDVLQGTRELDATGKFILPGFIDVHFHYNIKLDPKTSPWLPIHFLANGVTTLREMGNWIVEENHRWQSEIRALGLPMPRLLCTGPVLDGPNTVIPAQSIVLMDELDARRVANRLVDQGATSLKVYSRLPLSLIKVVAEVAHQRGVPVHGHLAVVDQRDAIEAGLDGVAHTNTICQPFLDERAAEAFRQKAWREANPGSMDLWAEFDPDGDRASRLIDFMLRHGTNLDGTLALHEPKPGRENYQLRVKSNVNLARFTVRYHQAGGSVTIGSHGSVPTAPPGFAFHREMAVHARAGMAPGEVLQAATRVGARALRLKDRGVVAAGKLADIVILDASPLEDISNTTRINTVILGGNVLDRSALLEFRPDWSGRW